MQTRFTRIARQFSALLLCFVLTATASRTLAQSQTSVPPVVITSPQTFAFTGAVQTFTVPTGVTKLHVVAYGASAATISISDGEGGSITVTGAKGGKVEADLAVTASQVLNIYVGGQGTASSGYNGGGSGGGNGYTYGGGATDIRIGGITTAQRVLVVGGAGGTASGTGGPGGGTTGGDGSGSIFGGKGGTSSMGGAGGLSNISGVPNAGSGSLGQGGNGYGGAGGGGGYYGGGGGNYNSGGGGSSYTGSLATNVVHTQGGNTGTNGSVTLTWSIITPVTLAYFNGRMTDAGAVLGWATAREDNNAGFRIERSRDAVSFEAIATVPSQSPDGNSVTTLTYAFTDAQPAPGTSYYRLRQTDRDGTVSLSRIVALSRERVASVLFPNPLAPSGEAVIEPALAHTGYSVVDMQGRVVQRQDAPGVLSRVSLAGLPAGVYLLRVNTEAGPAVFRVLR